MSVNSLSNTSQTVYLKDYRAPDFHIPKINLSFELAASETRVRSDLQVVRRNPQAQVLRLQGEEITLQSLTMDGKPVSTQQYHVSDSELLISNVGDTFALTIESICSPDTNQALMGLYQSSGNFCTQCEAEGFRRITYFIDRPDILSVYTVKIIADRRQCPVMLSNGNPQEDGILGDGRHWKLWHDPYPKPCYLFALVAGDLQRIEDQFVTQLGRKVALNIYAQKHNIDKCDFAMQSLKKAMRWDEEKYRRAYDLDVYNVVAVDDFNMGAMENKGLNIFNALYVLADSNVAQDRDYDNIENTVAHEYFHNWSGNRVTCRDWFQLSLKEGFTVFREQQFSASNSSQPLQRIRDARYLRTYQFNEDAGPMAHSVQPASYQEINNFYTSTVYEKGAEVIRMLSCLVGEDTFQRGSDLYFERYDGCAVTIEDFIHCMEEVSGQDLQQFTLWYRQAGTPQVTIKQRFSETVLHLEIVQKCPLTPQQSNKQAMVIPLALALFSQDGEKILEQTLVLRNECENFSFKDLSHPPGSFFIAFFFSSSKSVL